MLDSTKKFVFGCIKENKGFQVGIRLNGDTDSRLTELRDFFNENSISVEERAFQVGKDCVVKFTKWE